MNETPMLAAWLMTYLVHSTLLYAAVRAVTHVAPLSDALKETLWKVALVGGLLTATLQVSTGGGSLHIPLPAVSSGVAGEPVAAAKPGDPPVASVTPARAARVDTLFEPGHATPFSAPAPAGAESAAPLMQRSGLPAPAESAAPGTGNIFWTVVLLAWAGGAVALLSRFIFLRRRYFRHIGRRRLLARGFLVDTVDRLRRVAGLRRRPALTWSPRLFSPMALGTSEICVPERARTELCAEQQESMLAHEVAHLARRDALWLHFSAILENVFFMQPLNRLARRHLRETTEYLCDEWAARQTGRGFSLARCLAEVASWVEGSTLRPQAAACMARPGSALVQRIERLTGGARRKSASAGVRTITALAVLAAVAALAPAFALQPVDPVAASSGDAVAAAAPAPALALQPVDPVAASTGDAVASITAAPVSALLAPVAAASSGRSGGRNVNSSTSDGSSNWVWENDGRRISIRRRGQVVMDDEGPVSIDPGGSFRVEEERADGDRELRITSEGGELKYRYLEDGELRPYDRGARRWFNGIMQDAKELQRQNRRQRDEALRAAEDSREAAHRLREEQREMARLQRETARQLVERQREQGERQREAGRLRAMEQRERSDAARAYGVAEREAQRELRERRHALGEEVRQREQELRQQLDELRQEMQRMQRELLQRERELQEEYRRRDEESRRQLREEYGDDAPLPPPAARLSPVVGGPGAVTGRRLLSVGRAPLAGTPGGVAGRAPLVGTPGSVVGVLADSVGRAPLAPLPVLPPTAAGSGSEARLAPLPPLPDEPSRVLPAADAPFPPLPDPPGRVRTPADAPFPAMPRGSGRSAGAPLPPLPSSPVLAGPPAVAPLPVPVFPSLFEDEPETDGLVEPDDEPDDRRQPSRRKKSKSRARED